MYVYPQYSQLVDRMIKYAVGYSTSIYLNLLTVSKIFVYLSSLELTQLEFVWLF